MSRLAWAGVLGPVLFVVAFLIEGGLRAGYDPLRFPVSFLLLTERGPWMTAIFAVSGGLLIAFAVGLRRRLGSGPGALAAPVSIGVFGVGLIIAGVFVQDPFLGYPPGAPERLPAEPSASAYLHLLGAFFGFFGMAAASVSMGRRFRRQGRSRWAAYSFLTAAVVIVAFGASGSGPDGSPLLPAVAGLLQRVSLIAGLSWTAVLAWRGSA